MEKEHKEDKTKIIVWCIPNRWQIQNTVHVQFTYNTYIGTLIMKMFFFHTDWFSVGISAFRCCLHFFFFSIFLFSINIYNKYSHNRYCNIFFCNFCFVFAYCFYFFNTILHSCSNLN